MKIDKAIRVLAGSLILVSLALSYLISQYWLLLTAFVGVNLIQSAFTGFCPAEKILIKLGLAVDNDKSEKPTCCCH
jgi:glucan phosphoethanolaminetransferase (alkaline phosphatase superfamily)